jgi:hypothetical protein
MTKRPLDSDNITALGVMPRSTTFPQWGAAGPW